MKWGSKNIKTLQYGSKGIVKVMFGSKLIWEKFNAEESVNTILKSVIDGNELNNMNMLLSNIESSNQDFTDINNQLEEIINSSGNIISFTISHGNSSVPDTIYQAIEGMTWKDWLDSDYNVDGYYIVRSSIMCPGMDPINDIGSLIRTVSLNDIIEPDKRYEHEPAKP